MKLKNKSDCRLLEKLRVPPKGTHTPYKVDGLLLSLPIGFEMEPHATKFNTSYLAKHAWDPLLRESFKNLEW